MLQKPSTGSLCRPARNPAVVAMAMGIAIFGSLPLYGQVLKFESKIEKIASGESAEVVEFKQPFLFGLAYSPTGDQIAVTFRFATPLLLVSKTWTNKRRMPALYQVAFSPDGELFATAEGSDGLRLWDRTTDQVSTRFLSQKRSDVVRKVAFSPTGKWLASAHDDGTVRIWDVGTSQLTASFKGHRDAVLSVAFSRSGERLYSGGKDSTIQVWRTSNWTREKEVQGPKGNQVSEIVVAFDDSVIASVHSKLGVMIWNTETWVASVHGGYFSIASSSNEKRLALGGRDILLTDGSKKSERRLRVVANGGKSDTTTALAFTPDGKRLAAGNNLGELRVFSLD